MIADSNTRGAPPHWPVNTRRPAPAWNESTRPMPHIQKQPREWWPYVTFGGLTVMIILLAAIVVVLAR